jgi:tetratricopeptide (TPR) repeat protein
LLQDSIEQAEAKAGRSLQRSEVSNYWSAKAKDYISENPSAWLRLLWRKFENFSNAFEYDDLGIISELSNQRIILPGFHFGLVAALAVPGLLLAFFAVRKSRWVSFAILLQVASILPVFVTERYRLAAVPGLLVFAVYGLVELWGACVRGAARQVVRYAILLVAASVFVSIRRADPSLWALKDYNDGREALADGDLKRAEKELLLADAYVADNPDTNFAIGNLRLAQGNIVSAKARFDTTLRRDPVHKGALNNLGVLALNDQDWKQAATFFRTETMVLPNDSKSHFLLARAELGLGHTNIALSEADAALRLKPDQPEYRKLRTIIAQQL